MSKDCITYIDYKSVLLKNISFLDHFLTFFTKDMTMAEKHPISDSINRRFENTSDLTDFFKHALNDAELSAHKSTTLEPG